MAQAQRSQPQAEQGSSPPRRRRRQPPDRAPGRPIDLSGYVEVGVGRWEPKSMRAAERWKQQMASE
jgi:hypothetical protein